MARMLEPNDYLSFAVLIAVISVFSAPVSALSSIISRHTSYLKNINYVWGIRIIFNKFLLINIIFFIILLILSFVFKDYLVIFLKIKYNIINIGLWTILLILIIYFSLGYLQGIQNFKLVGFFQLIYAGAKVIACSSFVYCGFGVFGAALGILLSAGITAAYLSGIVFKLKPNMPALVPINKLSLTNSIGIIIANVVFIGVTQSDVLIVNYLYPPIDGGNYAIAATLGKSILYLTGGIVAALFPIASELHFKNRGGRTILIDAIAMTLLISFAVATLVYFLSDYLITFLFNDRYSLAPNILRAYIFAMIPWAVLMVLECHLIARGKFLLTWLFLSGAVLQVLTIYYFHGEILSIVFIIGASGAILLLTALMLTKSEFKR